MINLEMIRSDCIENGRPTMSGVTEAVQEYHGSRLKSKKVTFDTICWRDRVILRFY